MKIVEAKLSTTKELHSTRQILLHMGASLSPFVAIIAFSVTACNVNSGINVCML